MHIEREQYILQIKLQRMLDKQNEKEMKRQRILEQKRLRDQEINSKKYEKDMELKCQAEYIFQKQQEEIDKLKHKLEEKEHRRQEHSLDIYDLKRKNSKERLFQKTIGRLFEIKTNIKI
jgi:hypothetical protein